MIKKYSLVACTCIAIISALTSCAPSGKLSWVKTHNTTDVVKANPVKARQSISPIKAKQDVVFSNEQTEATARVTLHPMANPIAKISRNSKQTIAVVKRPSVITSIVLKAASHKIARARQSSQIVLGKADSDGGTIGYAIGLMIVGLILILVAAVFISPLGYLIYLVGSIIFVIGLIYLILGLV